MYVGRSEVVVVVVCYYTDSNRYYNYYYSRSQVSYVIVSYDVASWVIVIVKWPAMS